MKRKSAKSDINVAGYNPSSSVKIIITSDEADDKIFPSCDFCNLFDEVCYRYITVPAGTALTEITVDDNIINQRSLPVSDICHRRFCSFSARARVTNGMLRSKSPFRHPVLRSSLLMLLIALSVHIRISTAQFNANYGLLPPYDDTPVAARLTTTAGNSFYNDSGSSNPYGGNSATLVTDSIPLSNHLSDITQRSRELSRSRHKSSRFARFSQPSTSPPPATIIPDNSLAAVTGFNNRFQDVHARSSTVSTSRFMMLAPETKKSRGSRWWKIGLSKRPEDFSNLTALLISADGLKSSGGFYYNYAVRKMVAENNQLQVLPHQYDDNSDPDALNMIAGSDRSAYRQQRNDKDNAATASYRAAMLAPLFLHANAKLFNRKQRHLLKHFRGSIFSVAEAAEMAINECQYQFRGRQWNCPIDRNGMTVFGNVLDVASRETAFIYSLTSAALAYSIARGCKQGTIDKCSCSESGSLRRGRRLALGGGERRRREEEPALLSTMRGTLTSPMSNNDVAVDYVWSGCSDNFKHGDEFARRFTSAAERGTRDSRSLMNKHNNKAGNWHVGNMMERRCKCHGMSGSCTVQTCWWQLPPFRAIADQLKDRFDGASRVIIGNRVFVRRELRTPPPLLQSTAQNDFVRRKMGNFITAADETESSHVLAKQLQQQRYGAQTLSYLQPYDPQFKPPTAADLVYLEPSPEFCEPNLQLNIPGTHGRPCNETSQGMDGCDLLCCHRGYRTVIRVEQEKCRCKFKWCCKVECEVCRVEYRDVFCN